MMNRPKKWPVIGSLTAHKPNLHAVRQPPAPVVHSKHVYYRANGTGRDSYIETTSGGQNKICHATRDYREVFKKTLRGYDRSTSNCSLPRPAMSAHIGRRTFNKDPKFVQSLS
jgi:hypothetical protein